MDTRTLQEAYGDKHLPSAITQQQAGKTATTHTAELDLSNYHDQFRAAVLEMERAGETIEPEEYHQQEGPGLGAE